MKFPSAMTCTSLLLMGATFAHGKAIRGAATTTATAVEQRQLQQTFVSASDDFYTTEEGEDLDVSEGSGLLDNDDTNPGFGLTITSSTSTQGSLSVDDDGAFSYSPPNDDFVGVVSFSYRVCGSENNQVCDGATVTIRVIADPDKPDRAPEAEDDEWRIREGDTLEIRGDGVLANDRQGNPSNTLFICESRGDDNDDMEGDLDLDSDGQFDYEAPKCFRGSEYFFYRACYEDYEDMESNEARVRIIVDEGRPDEPRPSNDRYEILEGEELDIGGDGLLSNDDCDDDCYIEDHETSDGFEGDLEVDSDGSFEYKYEPGMLGTFTFTYTVCEDGWEDCVDCNDATVEIEVQENPAKPDAPTWDNARFTVESGEILNGDLAAASTNYDDRYTLEFSNFIRELPFEGSLDEDDNGTFEYGQSPVGEDTFSFTACYEEWPDLCTTDAQATVETIPSFSETVSISRLEQGIATFYEVNWSGEAQGSDCVVFPTITMRCNGAGALSFVELAASESPTNSNADCQTQSGTAQDGSIATNIVCSGQTAGTVAVECRDVLTNDETSRELSVVAQSVPVTCDTGGIGSNALNTISQSLGLKSICNSMLVSGGLTCSGTSIKDAAGNSVLCYETVAAVDGTATAPADITMTSSPNFDLCVGSPLDLVIGPPTLEFIGDADGEEPFPGFPLQVCQADCDDDDECAGDLICFDRDEGDDVPGCSGVAEEDRDYCVRPSQVESRNGAGSFP